MPWRPDYVKSFWIDPDYQGLGGHPEQEAAAVPASATQAPPSRHPVARGVEPPRSEEPATQVELSHLTWAASHQDFARIAKAVLSIRDRIGFEYERVIGLGDYVSVRDAADLLQLPVMTVNRWVRAKKLKSRKRNGFSVIQLRDVLHMAESRAVRLTMGTRLIVERS